MSQLHIGSDGSHEADTMNGTGATVAEIQDTLTTTISAGAKCNSEHGMSLLTTEQCGLKWNSYYTHTTFTTRV